MAHWITRADRALYYLKPAWHGLGEVLPESEKLTGTEALTRCRINWQTELEPLVLSDGCAIENWFVTCRSDLLSGNADRYLGVVRGRYEAVDNGELAEVVDGLCSGSGAYVESCGTLKGGKVVWFLARLPGEYQPVDGQAHREYLLVTTSHDGTASIQIRYVDIRVVCYNTLSAALGSGAQDTWNIRHTRTAHARLDQVRRILAGIEQFRDAHKARLAKLAQSKTSKDFERAFVNAMIPDPEPVNGHKPNNTRADNARREVLRLAHGAQARGYDDGVLGTAYGLYNAFVQYVEKREPGSTKRNRTEVAESRFTGALMSGHAANQRERAYQLICRATGADGKPALMEVEHYAPKTTNDANVDSLLASLDLQN